MVRREVAKKKQVKDLFKGEFKESKDMNTPNRVETDSDRFSRINTLATVEDTYMNAEETYGSIQVTDNTATIRVKAFDETTDYLEEIEKENIVKIIGKIREDEDGRFILGEIIKPVENPKYTELRELEIQKQSNTSKQQGKGTETEETKEIEEQEDEETEETEETKETEEETESFVEETGTIE